MPIDEAPPSPSKPLALDLSFGPAALFCLDPVLPLPPALLLPPAAGYLFVSVNMP